MRVFLGVTGGGASRLREGAEIDSPLRSPTAQGRAERARAASQAAGIGESELRDLRKAQSMREVNISGGLGARGRVLGERGLAFLGQRVQARTRRAVS